MKSENKWCSENEFIDTYLECKLAVRYMNTRGSNIVFRSTDSRVDRPKGCYYNTNQGAVGMGGGAYWNSHNRGSANKKRPEDLLICKGYLIELITINFLNTQ